MECSEIYRRLMLILSLSVEIKKINVYKKTRSMSRISIFDQNFDFSPTLIF